MATRKKKKTTTVRRRRVSGVGALGKGNTTEILKMGLGIALGAYGAEQLNSLLSSRMSPKMAAGAKIVAGMGLAAMSRNSIVRGIGGGLVASGGTDLAKTTGLISGYNYVPIAAGVDMDVYGRNIDRGQYVAGAVAHSSFAGVGMQGDYLAGCVMPKGPRNL